MFFWGHFVFFPADNLLSIVDQKEGEENSNQSRVDCKKKLNKD